MGFTVYVEMSSSFSTHTYTTHTAAALPPQLHNGGLLLPLLPHRHHQTTHLQTTALSRRRHRSILPNSRRPRGSRLVPSQHTGLRHTTILPSHSGTYYYMYIHECFLNHTMGRYPICGSDDRFSDSCSRGWLGQAPVHYWVSVWIRLS